MYLCEAREMQLSVQQPPLGKMMHTCEREVHKSRQCVCVSAEELVG